MAVLLVVLLAVVVLSVVPLAGSKGGWAQFAMDNINTDVMVQLGLAPWNHYIDVGYVRVNPQSELCCWAGTRTLLQLHMVCCHPCS